MTHKNKADESHREAYGANSGPANTLNELGIHIHEYEEDSGLGRRRGVRRGEGSEARQNNDDQIVRQNRQKMI